MRARRKSYARTWTWLPPWALPLVKTVRSEAGKSNGILVVARRPHHYAMQPSEPKPHEINELPVPFDFRNSRNECACRTNAKFGIGHARRRFLPDALYR